MDAVLWGRCNTDALLLLARRLAVQSYGGGQMQLTKSADIQHLLNCIHQQQRCQGQQRRQQQSMGAGYDICTRDHRPSVGPVYQAIIQTRMFLLTWLYLYIHL
jgi:hypothetical protein